MLFFFKVNKRGRRESCLRTYLVYLQHRAMMKHKNRTLDSNYIRILNSEKKIMSSLTKKSTQI